MIKDTLSWLQALYGKCSEDDGDMVVVCPSKNRRAGIYPLGSAAKLGTAALLMRSLKGHYLKINPMNGAMIRERARLEFKGPWIVGKKEEVKTIVSFHLDVDAGKSDKYLSRHEAIEALYAMPQPPSMIVNSNGDIGGFHAYWLLESPHRIADEADRQRISDAATRWQNRLNALANGKLDATANIDRVLRIVGLPRVDGGMVCCHEFHGDRVYSIDDLTIRPTRQEIKESAAKEIKRRLDSLLGPVKKSGMPISDYIGAAGITVEHLLAEAGYQHLQGDEWIRPGSESGNRSLKLATKHDLPGINVFSGKDPNFDCIDQDGNVGRFYSIDQVFVRLRHRGDWKAAAQWCRQQIGLSKFSVLENAR